MECCYLVHYQVSRAVSKFIFVKHVQVNIKNGLNHSKLKVTEFISLANNNLMSTDLYSSGMFYYELIAE